MSVDGMTSARIIGAPTVVGFYHVQSISFVFTNNMLSIINVADGSAWSGWWPSKSRSNLFVVRV